MRLHRREAAAPAPLTRCAPGYAGWIGRVSEIDSVIVEILYECGAVPFVRTNVPQTLFVSRRHSSHRHPPR